MKFAVLLVFVSSAAGLTMSWGNLRERNLLVFDQLFIQKMKPNFITCESKTFTTKHAELITAIHVTDLTHNQDGGRVKITCGGVGFTFVRFQTTSDCGKTLLLNIEIFASERNLDQT